jgi:hypothetical protein
VRWNQESSRQSGEDKTMRTTTLAAALALAAACGLTLAPAEAAPRHRVTIVEGRGQTVYSYTDENGRRHTRVIIQKRSYLDPGTAALPSDRRELDYIVRPNERASDVLDNTAFGGNQTALPNNWTLPFRDNPYIGGW